MDGTTPAADAPQRPPGRGRKRIRIAFLLLVAVLVIVAGVIYWLDARRYESTDDAFIDGNVVQISAQVSGIVSAVAFDDNQEVRKGDVLIEIDPRDYEAALASAQATLDTMQAQRDASAVNLQLIRITSNANLEEATSAQEQARSAVEVAKAQAEVARAASVRAGADLVRDRELMLRGNVSHQRLDQSTADQRSTAAQLQAALRNVAVAESLVEQATARLNDAKSAPQKIAQAEAQLHTADGQVEKARADLKQAQLNLSYTKIYAPAAGRITKKSVQPGDQIQKSQIIVQLVSGTPWIVANFKETQLTHMRPGQPVEIRVDAYPSASFKGHVDSIQKGTGAHFSLLPPENATGNFVKVVQRVPVKIVFDGAIEDEHLLGLGMSVVPTVEVAERGNGNTTAGAAPVNNGR
ncbi:MAG TPA: HlyD family secretion protein [Candidatus Cybelea sp.]|nr:HlyD family secretion protein [Candidatus Cybelea sp.]